ncbi:MAG: hypothetical protein H7Z71_11905 [Moraxellaceae bacterium]|nr:hypothetical protein [Pseudobdellovibrionaceae bacterium]
MALEKVEIIVCVGCIGKNFNFEYELEDLMVQVKNELQKLRPDKIWNLNVQACFRFCPKDRITLSVSEKMTMTREATVESIIKEILSFNKIS